MSEHETPTTHDETGDRQSAADVLAEMTGRDRSEFDYEGDVPDFDEQEITIPDDGPWTHFWDMSSGGDVKINGYHHIFIEAPRQEAIDIFKERFGHDPYHVTCECCGEDYRVQEKMSLKQATGYQRNCRAIITPKDENGQYMNRHPVVMFHSYLEPGEEPPGEFEVADKWPRGGDHIPLEEYVERDDVLIIESDDIEGGSR